MFGAKLSGRNVFQNFCSFYEDHTNVKFHGSVVDIHVRTHIGVFLVRETSHVKQKLSKIFSKEKTAKYLFDFSDITFAAMERAI